MSNAMIVERAVEPAFAAAAKPHTAFSRDARIGLALGGLGFGALVGFAAAMSIGRADLVLNVVGAAVFVIAFTVGAMGLRQCVRDQAYGCAAVSMLHITALVAWLGMSVSTDGAPMAISVPAIASLLLLASCWTRSDGGVYRTALQALVIGFIASAQFLTMAMGV